MTPLSLALQGGGSHGAFTWGALDRLLDEVEAGRLSVAAVSGASAGALNAVVVACALAEGGPSLARARLAELWRTVSEEGDLAGNALFYGSPGPFGFNIDWNPGAIALEALGLLYSPYANPFYRDTLMPILQRTLGPERLAALRSAQAPRVYITAVDVGTTQRCIFEGDEISHDTVRASCALPTEFRAVQLGDSAFWDGGFLGNPSLSPLLQHADDLMLILVNPLLRDGGPPTASRAILNRLNEITFNSSVVLEMNAIDTVNRLLRDLAGQGIDYRGKFKPIHLHMIRDDAVLAQFGYVSKNSTSWPLLEALHRAGHAAADRLLAERGGDVGHRSSCDITRDFVRPVLNATAHAAAE